jgi:hypothetical protein
MGYGRLYHFTIREKAMSNQEYNDLWHYSEQFTRDKLQRSELVTMAWKEGEKLGPRCNLKLMKSAMHFRARELNKRSAFPAEEVGKRAIDAWNRPERVYLDRPTERGESLAEFLLPMRTTPLDFTIANDFMDALSDKERSFLDDLTAGYSLKDISQRQHISSSNLQSFRHSIQEKAVAYL